MMKLVDSIFVVIQVVGWNKKLTIKSEEEDILLQKRKDEIISKKKREKNKKRENNTSRPPFPTYIYYYSINFKSWSCKINLKCFFFF